MNTQMIGMIFMKILKNVIQIKCKILIVFDDMIADMLNDQKKLYPIVTKLFIRSRKLNISLAFSTQSSFALLKNGRLNSTHYFIMKIPNKRELKQIAFDHSLDIDLKDYVHLYKICTVKPYSYLVIDDTLAPDNPLRFRENPLERI